MKSKQTALWAPAIALVTVMGCSLLGCKAKVEVKTAPPPPAPQPAPPPPPAPAPVVKHITVSERIQFEVDSAVLKEHSKVTLNEVVKVLNTNPHITLVEIGGHTDSTGDATKNLLLSQARAESVRAYLMSQSVDGARMRAMGYGDRVPVVGNDTTLGREQNRRVEFRIVKQGP